MHVMGFLGFVLFVEPPVRTAPPRFGSKNTKNAPRFHGLAPRTAPPRCGAVQNRGSRGSITRPNYSKDPRAGDELRHTRVRLDDARSDSGRFQTKSRLLQSELDTSSHRASRLETELTHVRGGITEVIKALQGHTGQNSSAINSSGPLPKAFTN
ncbi:uncharacterized protein N7506_000138 [Penicillium brevicompactum]|uniref:uncharacterized protein n=1 Tax=Penicillium brevicompactum TaxID=5074 RepID=UPI002540C26A|nr:uncharacterized protein N7506_000138 [Penicillium brevicompactum]KAJ5346885.1 hypothetical protein N7506_000138 [Penicillium brevicompactum]